MTCIRTMQIVNNYFFEQATEYYWGYRFERHTKGICNLYI